MPWTGPSFGANLPVELTSFVGRRRELAELKRLLGESRLVTLTGVGGTGKTRLALRVATEARRAFPDGVWFVDLTALRAPELLVFNVQDPDVLAYLVMVALGLREQPGKAAHIDQLVGYVRDRRVLLVLDNCEHLLPMCAVLVDALLRGCPDLRILATSREPLLVAGEVTFAVPPLPAPQAGASVDVLERFESVALFVARARAVAPDFALIDENAGAVAELCRGLDGLPLAIELAAARMRVLAPGQILDRLVERFALLSRGNRNAPQRQQTLRACADWSFELCTKPERALWARLAVFAGGCDLDAVEGVCTDEAVPAAELLEVLTGLIDKSILVRDDSAGGAAARYRMLETLRDYGQDKLQAWGEHLELRRRHRDWYTDLARRAEADWISSRQPYWLARIDRELPNLRAALEYSLADPDGAEAALTVLGSTFFYWAISGLHREGRSWADQALARPTGPTMARLKTLYLGTAMAIAQGDLPAARSRMRQGYEVATQRGDPLGYAFADTMTGVTEMAADLAESVQAWQRAADGFAAEPGDEYLFWRVNTLSMLAMAKAMHAGAAAGNEEIHEEILALCQPRGETWFAGTAQYTLGLGLWQQGDGQDAAARLQEGVSRLRRVNDTLGTAWCLDVLAWIAYDEGRPERAATLLGVTTQLARTMGALPSFFPDLAAHHERYAQRAHDALGEQAYQAAFTRGEQLSLDEAVAYALNQPLPPPATPPSADASTPLTRRERQVADLVAEGLSNKEIAAKLVISQRTAESHVQHILEKLGLNNRAQVAAWTATQR